MAEREMQIEAKKSDLAWDTDIPYEKYGFEVFQIYKNGKPTDFKAIYQTSSDRIVAIPRVGYRLLPNEIVLEASNRAAVSAGLEQFRFIADSVHDWKKHEKSKNKYYTSKKAGHTIVQDMPGNPHALLSGDATRIFAFYKMPKLVVMDKTDEINFGLCVRNSVDGTSGLAIDGFTFRHICGNATLMTLAQIVKAGLQAGYHHRHTKNLDISLSNLDERFGLVISQLSKIRDMYSNWMVTQLNKDVASKLGRNIPVKYLPDYISVEKKKVTLTADPMPTLWQTYNGITDAVWHSQAELKTKQVIFEKLHDVYLKI